MQHSTLPALLGYDRALLALLKEDEQRQIERVAEAWFLSSALLACPLGYAAWLIEHSLLLACVLGAGALFVVLNMLRLSIAGGGVPARALHKDVTQYRPALGATVVIAMLALLFAQPAQLPLWRTELAATVAEHRQQLIARHDRSLAALGQATDDHYRAQILSCEFVVLRLTTIWKQPTRALQLTAFYVLVVLLPTLWARFIALTALRAYALARWQRERRFILRAHAQSERERSVLLSRFPSYLERESAFADPAFETRVASALLVPRLVSLARGPARFDPQPARKPKRRWFQRWQSAPKAGDKP
jgi:hypothetical protein